MDFSGAAAKLAREQAARASVARVKLDAERREAEKVRSARALAEEQARERRVAAAEAAEAAEAARLAELAQNRGITWQETLAPVPRDEAEALAKGVRRAESKLVLPASAEHLATQDVARNGPMFFSLTSASGRRTHAVRLPLTRPPPEALSRASSPLAHSSHSHRAYSPSPRQTAPSLSPRTPPAA